MLLFLEWQHKRLTPSGLSLAFPVIWDFKVAKGSDSRGFSRGVDWDAERGWPSPESKPSKLAIRKTLEGPGRFWYCFRREVHVVPLYPRLGWNLFIASRLIESSRPLTLLRTSIYKSRHWNSNLQYHQHSLRLWNLQEIRWAKKSDQDLSSWEPFSKVFAMTSLKPMTISTETENLGMTLCLALPSIGSPLRQLGLTVAATARTHVLKHWRPTGKSPICTTLSKITCGQAQLVRSCGQQLQMPIHSTCIWLFYNPARSIWSRKFVPIILNTETPNRLIHDIHVSFSSISITES